MEDEMRYLEDYMRFREAAEKSVTDAGSADIRSKEEETEDGKAVYWKCPDCGHLWLDYGLIERCTVCESREIMIGWNQRDEIKYERTQRNRLREISRTKAKRQKKA